MPYLFLSLCLLLLAHAQTSPPFLLSLTPRPPSPTLPPSLCVSLPLSPSLSTSCDLCIRVASNRVTAEMKLLSRVCWAVQGFAAFGRFMMDANEEAQQLAKELKIVEVRGGLSLALAMQAWA
jgi:hypothetical protein